MSGNAQINIELIKESFDPKLIVALYKNFSDKYIALQELIDNAVDDRLDDRTLVVIIDYDEEKHKLLLKNDYGKGMNIQDLHNFFSWGLSEKRSGKIGRYGQGGKAALGYLAKSFIIKSHPIDSTDGYSIKVTNWEDRESGFKEFQIEKFGSLREKGESSVLFEIYNLKKTFNIKKIKEKITEVYRPLIANNKVEFIVDGEKLNCPEINYDEGTFKKFKLNLSVNDKNYNLYGEYGIVSDTKSDRGGFKIFQYGRCVSQKEYFGHTDPSKRWNVERLYGELNVDFDIPLLMNKTDVDEDSDLWRAICQKLHEEIEPIVKEAIDYRAPSKKETKALEKLKKKIKKCDRDQEIDMQLSNYGPRLLFKVDVDKNGKKIIKINREHKAYIKWSATEHGKRLYNVMIYSIFEAVEKMSKKDAGKFLNEFSETLINNSNKLL